MILIYYLTIQNICYVKLAMPERIVELSCLANLLTSLLSPRSPSLTYWSLGVLSPYVRDVSQKLALSKQMFVQHRPIPLTSSCFESDSKR